jgi:hypothetical protein
VCWTDLYGVRIELSLTLWLDNDKIRRSTPDRAELVEFCCQQINYEQHHSIDCWPGRSIDHREHRTRYLDPLPVLELDSSGNFWRLSDRWPSYSTVTSSVAICEANTVCGALIVLAPVYPIGLRREQEHQVLCIFAWCFACSWTTRSYHTRPRPISMDRWSVSSCRLDLRQSRGRVSSHQDLKTDLVLTAYSI